MTRCIPCVEKKLRKLVQDKSQRIHELEAENNELRLEIIAATGQAQTALEENAKLREAAQAVVDAAHVKYIPEEVGGYRWASMPADLIDALAKRLEGE